jgi:3',5'-cyclic AMP phosphodiesterase CpdA
MSRDPSATDLGSHLFTFAIIADSHMNESETQSASPYECNKLANARSRRVMAEINRLNPDFTIHLGDMVNPVPHLPSYASAANNFLELFGALNCDLHLVPGNHDIGDKQVDWMPAGCVKEEYIELYQRHFGKDFYSFQHKGCHFVIINAPLINSGLDAETAQRQWLEQDLADNSDKRIFLNSHYPPYIAERDENSSYDNIDEPGRSWLLDLLEHHNVEALYSAHVHNFFYNCYGNTESYVLPSICFVRHDYSELFKIAPGAGATYGRDDVAKLGYFIVKIYENGHVNHTLRTYGKVLEPGGVLSSNARRIECFHSKEMAVAPVGVDLRDSWAGVAELPPSGAIDEFERKRVRNDYSLMAIWEMGIRKLRIPLHDLADDTCRRRIRHLRRLGHEFTAYSYGIPQHSLRQALGEHHVLLSSWEVVTKRQQLDTTISALREMKAEAAQLPIYISKLRGFEDRKMEGSHFNHLIDYGFRAHERDHVGEWLEVEGAREAVDGIVFRVPRVGSPWEQIHEIARIADDFDIGVTAHIRFAGENPAEAFNNDGHNANRVAESIAAAMSVERVSVFLDTFLDVDRGYFARTGLLDRRYNPRPGSFVFRYLQAALGGHAAQLAQGRLHALEGGQLLSMYGAGGFAALMMPDVAMSVGNIPADTSGLPETGEAQRVDLRTGVVTYIPWRSSEGAIILDELTTCETPTLLRSP